MKDYFTKLKQLFSAKDLIFTVLLFTIILTMAFCKGQNLMDVTFGAEAVDIVTSKFSMNIPYDMVESIELAEIPDAGEEVNGMSDITLQTGLWSNEAWGEYHACLDLQTNNCIVVHLNDGRTFVFSHKSDKTVAEEYEIFQSYLNP